MRLLSLLAAKSCAALLVLALAGCGTAPLTSPRSESPDRIDVVMFALALRDTGYQFGGKNPEAGLDCSGMATYVYQKAVGRNLSGNAAALARQGRHVSRDELRAGDLVFFNTLGRPYSHVGIYIGKDEFIHAPSSKGRVRVDKMTNSYYANRFEMARALLD